MDITAAPLPAYERSARRGLTTWGVLLVGAMFLLAAYTVDPRDNCGPGGECAPWLVPVAGVMGFGAVAIALAQLLANPRRGYRFDPLSGDLIWWKNRTARSPGDTGRVHPSRIASVRIDRRHEDHSLSLYGDDGERLPFFDEEVAPWPHEDWAERLTQAYPHIRIEVLD